MCTGTSKISGSSSSTRTSSRTTVERGRRYWRRTRSLRNVEQAESLKPGTVTCGGGRTRTCILNSTLLPSAKFVFIFRRPDEVMACNAAEHSSIIFVGMGAAEIRMQHLPGPPPSRNGPGTTLQSSSYPPLPRALPRCRSTELPSRLPAVIRHMRGRGNSRSTTSTLRLLDDRSCSAGASLSDVLAPPRCR